MPRFIVKYRDAKNGRQNLQSKRLWGQTEKLGVTKKVYVGIA